MSSNADRADDWWANARRRHSGVSLQEILNRSILDLSTATSWPHISIRREIVTSITFPHHCEGRPTGVTRFDRRRSPRVGRGILVGANQISRRKDRTDYAATPEQDLFKFDSLSSNVRVAKVALSSWFTGSYKSRHATHHLLFTASSYGSIGNIFQWS